MQKQSIQKSDIKEKFEDTKGVIRSQNRRTENARKKGQNLYKYILLVYDHCNTEYS
jgi:hypothetical protein